MATTIVINPDPRTILEWTNEDGTRLQGLVLSYKSGKISFVGAQIEDKKAPIVLDLQEIESTITRGTTIKILSMDDLVPEVRLLFTGALQTMDFYSKQREAERRGQPGS